MAQPLQAIWLSAKVSLICTLLILPLSIATAWWLARHEIRGKAFWESILHLPLVMPPVATGYLLLLLLGRRGLLGGLLYDTLGLQLTFHWSGAVLASAVVAFPLVTRSVRASFEMLDPSLEQAASSLGADPGRTFFLITLPQALPGILSGVVLGFARSLGEFGATMTFAGNLPGETQTIPLAVYAEMQVPGREGSAMALVGVSVLISLAALCLSESLSRRSRSHIYVRSLSGG